jgi:hypothetical protein
MSRASFPDSGPARFVPAERAVAGRPEAESVLGRIPGVEGVGEGRTALGDPEWICYVRDRHVMAQLPSEIAGRSVVPEVTGEIDILPAR